ncbi:MAG: FN3 associated domain-containing protein [Erysipelotrichaceae bacterium]|nr:FN3 associated domain-containing protein [Erysipelotrichaceae bacterium]
MAIYLHEKYAKEVEQKFTLDSVIAGKCSNKYTFEGVKTVNIPTIVAQDLTDYTRSGMQRYGEPKEVQDTMQSMTMEYDKGFSLTVDKGNNSEQNAIKNAGRVLKVQMEEKVIPLNDKLALFKWTQFAGKVAGVAAALTKDTVLAEIRKCRKYFVDHKIKMKEGTIYLGVPSSVYTVMLELTEFIEADKLGEELLSNGVVGKIYNMLVTEMPEDYFTDGVQFLAWKSDAVLNPKKIWDTKIHMDPPGLSGHLLEGRFIFDGFVIGEKSDAVYACVLNSKKLTCSITTSTGAITSSGSSLIMYTTDGTDPRYSKSAKVYSAALGEIKSGTVRAVGFSNLESGKFTSDVAEASA